MHTFGFRKRRAFDEARNIFFQVRYSIDCLRPSFNCRFSVVESVRLPWVDDEKRSYRFNGVATCRRASDRLPSTAWPAALANVSSKDVKAAMFSGVTACSLSRSIKSMIKANEILTAPACDIVLRSKADISPHSVAELVKTFSTWYAR